MVKPKQSTQNDQPIEEGMTRVITEETEHRQSSLKHLETVSYNYYVFFKLSKCMH